MADQATTSQPVSQTGPTAGPPQADPFTSMMVMVVPMILFMYFLVIRPQRKEQKKKEEMLGRLKPKDKVITFTGIYGQVVEIDGDDVVLLVDNKKDVKMRFRRSAIDGIVASSDSEEKKEK